MKRPIKVGFVDYSALVFIPDPASTVGKGKTGLVAANLTVSYVRVETDNDVTVTDVTGSLSNLTALTDAHADWGLKEVSATLAPGLYRLDIADAVFAAGAWSAVVYVMITSGLAAASPMEFVLGTQDFTQADGVKLAAHLPGVLQAVIAAGSSTTEVVLNATTGIDGAAPSSTNDFYNGAVIVFTSGALAGQRTSISDYVGATKTLTVVALTGAPSAADTAVIV